MDYHKKYIKYKLKYLKLKGGGIIENKRLYNYYNKILSSLKNNPKKIIMYNYTSKNIQSNIDNLTQYLSIQFSLIDEHGSKLTINIVVNSDIYMITINYITDVIKKHNYNINKETLKEIIEYILNNIDYTSYMKSSLNTSDLDILENIKTNFDINIIKNDYIDIDIDDSEYINIIDTSEITTLTLNDIYNHIIEICKEKEIKEEEEITK